MVRFTLDIAMEPYDNRVHGSAKRRGRWLQELVATLRPLADQTFSELPQFVVDADSPKAPELLTRIEELMDHKVARPLGACEITERLIGDERRPVEWFEITPTPSHGYGWVWPKPLLEFNRQTPDPAKWPALNRYGLKTIRASQQRSGRNLAKQGMSERVKALVEEHRLTGLQLLWIPDTGRLAAPQWYLPIATEPLGRGVDHPWFDPAWLQGQSAERSGSTPPDPLWRFGVRGLHSAHFRPGVCYGDAVKDRAIAICGGARIGSYRRVVRRYLPQTDFAYTWEWVEDLPHRRLTWRQPCCNRQTRDLLIAEGLATDEDFVGIEVLDRPYKGAEVLDRLPGGPAGPGPYLSPEAMAEVCAELDRWHAEFLAKPRKSPSKPDA